METEDNKVLAEFMELPFQEADGLKMYSYDDWGYLAGDLEYSTSWSWLMPVVEKIAKIEIDEVIHNGEDSYFNSFYDNSAILFAYAVAAQAELKAMELQNEIDKGYGRELTYPPDRFFSVEANLQSLINQYR